MGTRSSFFIANVNGAQGLYTCKATNDYGTEMSSAGELKIKGNTNVSTVVYSSNYREPEHGVPTVLACFSHRVTEQKKRSFVDTLTRKWPYHRWTFLEHPINTLVQG